MAIKRFIRDAWERATTPPADLLEAADRQGQKLQKAVEMIRKDADDADHEMRRRHDA